MYRPGSVSLPTRKVGRDGGGRSKETEDGGGGRRDQGSLNRDDTRTYKERDEGQIFCRTTTSIHGFGPVPTAPLKKDEFTE